MNSSPITVECGRNNRRWTNISLYILRYTTQTRFRIIKTIMNLLSWFILEEGEINKTTRMHNQTVKQESSEYYCNLLSLLQ